MESVRDSSESQPLIGRSVAHFVRSLSPSTYSRECESSAPKPKNPLFVTEFTQNRLILADSPIISGRVWLRARRPAPS